MTVPCSFKKMGGGKAININLTKSHNSYIFILAVYKLSMESIL